MTDTTMRIMLTATDGASPVIAGLMNTLAGSGGLLGILGKGGESGGLIGLAVGVDVAIAGMAVKMGVDAVQAAGNFQQSLTKLYTTAGETQANLQMVGDGILTMAPQVGTGAQTLADAMYWIESGGLHGAQGLEALRVAAQAAKAENANLDSVSIALAASLNAYASAGMTPIQVMNTLTAATGQGMMTFEQLSGSLSSVLPASAKFGISLTDVTGALATMTAQGDPAAQAATHLKQVILALEAPSKIGAKSLADVGLTSTQVANEMKISLPGALQMIMTAVGKKFPEGSAAYNQAIKNIAIGSKQMMGFLELTGSHMQTFSNNVTKISSAVKSGGNNLNGWSAIQQNMNFQLARANAAFGVLLITVGQQLAPAVTQVAAAMVPFIQGLASVAMWIMHNWAIMTALKVLLGVLAVIIGVAVVAALIMMIFQMTMLLLALLPIIVIVLGIAWVFQHWGQIAHWLQGVWAAFIGWCQSAFGAMGAWFGSLWTLIVDTAKMRWMELVVRIQAIVSNIKTWLANTWQNIVNTVVGWFTWLYNHNYYFQQLVDKIRSITTAFTAWFTAAWQKTVANVTALWDFIKGVAQRDWTAMTGAIQTAVSAAVSWLQGAWNNAVSFLAGIWQKIEQAVQLAWQFISGVFSSAWNTYIAPPLNNIGNMITSFFSNLASMALQWGKNMIQGFINGMSSMIGNVKNAAGNIISAAGNFLGFHSPAKEGPGRELDVWGPNMVKGFAHGMLTQLPMLQNTMHLMMAPVSRTFGNPQAGITSGIAPTGIAPSGGSSTQGGVTVIIQNISVNDFGPNMPQTVVNQLTQMISAKLAQNMRTQRGGIVIGQG